MRNLLQKQKKNVHLNKLPEIKATLDRRLQKEKKAKRQNLQARQHPPKRPLLRPLKGLQPKRMPSAHRVKTVDQQ